MPATSKKQFRLIMGKRKQFESKAKTPKGFKWIWIPDWIEGVEYNDLPDEAPTNESIGDLMSFNEAVEAILEKLNMKN